MEVFPHFIIRISSGEYGELNTLRLEKAYKYVSEINNHDVSLSSIASDLCNKIYQLVPSIKQKKDRDVLIEAKRDIYNKRQISPKTVDTILTYIKEGTLVSQYCEFYHLREKKIREFKKAFVKESAEAEIIFKKLTESENFKKGLLLSSQELFELAEKKYWIASPQKNRTFYSIQQGFSKYISRIYTKTSPFSTFTHVGFGGISDIFEEGKFIKVSPKETRKREYKSVIEPNNYILKT